MNQPTPEPVPASPQPRAPARGDARTGPPNDTRAGRQQTRLQAIVGNEPIIRWSRGWVSREVRLHVLLAARTLDFLVLTDRSLMLVTTGFLSRRPRRLVYAANLDTIFVSDESVPRGGRRLRIVSKSGHPLWIELGATSEQKAFAAALVARSRPVQP